MTLSIDAICASVFGTVAETVAVGDVTEGAEAGADDEEAGAVPLLTVNEALTVALRVCACGFC